MSPYFRIHEPFRADIRDARQTPQLLLNTVGKNIMRSGLRRSIFYTKYFVVFVGCLLVRLLRHSVEGLPTASDNITDTREFTKCHKGQ